MKRFSSTSKRRNNKRLCDFCKVTFPSQRSYNGHVNTCDETPKYKKKVKRAR